MRSRSIREEILGILSDYKKHTAKEIAEKAKVGINTVYRHISSLSCVKTITTFSGRFGGIKMFPTEEEKKTILTESEIERMIELLRVSKLRENVNIIAKLKRIRNKYYGEEQNK